MMGTFSTNLPELMDGLAPCARDRNGDLILEFLTLLAN